MKPGIEYSNEFSLGPRSGCLFTLFGEKSYAKFTNLQWPMQLFVQSYHKVTYKDEDAGKPVRFEENTLTY